MNLKDMGIYHSELKILVININSSKIKTNNNVFKRSKYNKISHNNIY